jgi:hypothetical protein
MFLGLVMANWIEQIEQLFCGSFRGCGIVPGNEPAVDHRIRTPIQASAPQNVTRATDFQTGEPLARAAMAPSSARNKSEPPETVPTRADRGTIRTAEAAAWPRQ